MRKYGILGAIAAVLISGTVAWPQLSVPAPSWTYAITSLGTGVATALGINVGSAGAPVVNGGALGTPSSGTATNLSGTAASLTAGNVTTNANLTGEVTSVGNAATVAASGRLKSKIISITRDLSLAAGNVAYTGVGFTPTALIVTGGTSANYVTNTVISGFSDSAQTAKSVGAFGGAFTTQNFLATLADATSTNYQTATVASYDADGFTLTWGKVGSPTGTATIEVLALR